MTTTNQAPTVRIPCDRSPSGEYELDRERFVAAYQRFTELLLEAPTPFGAGADLLEELVGDGMETNEARRYMWAARSVWENYLDPGTGQPLAGIDVIEPGRIDEAIKLVCAVMPDDTSEELASHVARRAIETLAAAGWRPRP